MPQEVMTGDSGATSSRKASPMSEFLQNVSENVTGHESPEKGRPGVDTPDGPRADAVLGDAAGPEGEATGTLGLRIKTRPGADLRRRKTRAAGPRTLEQRRSSRRHSRSHV